MKLRNMWMVLSCITFAFISLSCTNVNIPQGTTVEHTPKQKQKEQAKAVASNFISGVFKNDDPKKAVFGAALEAAFLKNLADDTGNKDISAEAITKAIGAAGTSQNGCLLQFLKDNDPTGNIIAKSIVANLEAAAGAGAAEAAEAAGGGEGGVAPAAAPVAPAADPTALADAAVAVKSKAKMTDFFDKLIKAGIEKDCFK